MYQDLMAQHYMNLSTFLSRRCTLVNTYNVSFLQSMPSLVEENILKVKNRARVALNAHSVFPIRVYSEYYFAKVIVIFTTV